jgi:hypothetical protein
MIHDRDGIFGKWLHTLLATTNSMEAMKSVWTHCLDGLLIEYDVGFTDSLRVLENVSFSQELARVPILVIAPNQVALDEF